MIKKQRNINFGAAILFLLFSVLFFVLLLRFFYIQSTGEVKGQVLAAKAEQQYAASTKIEARRGTIYDRNGEVLAEDRNSFSLIAILSEDMKPNHVVDLKKTARELAKYINLEESKIYKILEDGKNKGRFQVEFGSAGRDISYETKSEIEKLELPGIAFTRSMKRYYPNGIFASHVIGYTETEEGKNHQTKTIGKLGLEKSLNDYLTGTNGSFKFESDLWGYLLPNGKEEITPAKDGKDVYLTIDRKIQILLEDALNKVNKEFEPKKIIAIVADAKTGEILGMGQRPTFNPVTRQGIEKSWYNEAVETSFEPGSTMKIFTLAAAVEEGVFNPNEKYQSGTYSVDPRSRKVPDHNGGRGWGPITYLEGVQRSSNVAFAKLANEKLGFERFREYLTHFGLDQPTGIDLPNETDGKLAFTYPIEKATTSFGQGTAITPIQQVQATTAITNDGNMMRTHVVDKIVDPDTNKTVKETKPEVVGTPISAKTAREVRNYLGTVVSGENGTGKIYAIEGYDVAGKTGTAQIPGKGGYLSGAGNYIYSFLGMAPMDDPELIMYVAVQQPDLSNNPDGATPVSMIFNTVMKGSLQYLQIEPNGKKPAETAKIPSVIGLSTSEAVKSLTDKGLNPIVIGNGAKIIRQIPAQDETLLAGERVVIKTDGDITVPEMTGWSIRDVMKVAEVADLKLNSVGNGYVVKQNIQEDTVIKPGEFLIVELNDPKTILSREKEDDESDETDEVEVKD